VDDHPAQKDVIDPAQIVVANIRYVQIDQLEIPRGRQHRRDSQQAERRESGLLGYELQYVPEAPECVGIARINKKHFHSQSPFTRPGNMQPLRFAAEPTGRE
jgi:hypothetical protein